MKLLIAKTYDFVHRYLPLFPAFFAPFPFLSFRPSPLAFFSYLQEFTRHRPPIRITNADELDTAAAPPPNLVHVISRHATGRSRAAVMSQLMLLRLPQWIVVYTIDVKAPFGECLITFCFRTIRVLLTCIRPLCFKLFTASGHWHTPPPRP